jgi:uncharacterized protein (TIGR02246 family)
MKTTWTLIGLLLGAGTAAAQAPAAGTTQAQAAPAGDAKGVRDAFAAYLKAFETRNAAALAALFAEDGALIDDTGTATRGREAIQRQYAESFAADPNLKVEAALEAVRFLTPDVVQVEGTAKLTPPNVSPSSSRFSALAVKKGGQWQIAEVRDYPAPEPDILPSERLAELAWLVGDWVDESAGSKVVSNIRWGDDKAFLLRTYAAHFGDQKATSGLMIVAWDPQTSQIKSWTFDSEGGQGEGYWTRSGDDQWVVKSSGVLRDGTATSATQTVTRVNKDALKFTSTDRVVGGEFAPDIDEIVMVRKPPAPTTGAPSAAPAAPVGVPAPARP